MAQPKRTPFDLWKDTIDNAKIDPSWNDYDSSIKKTVDTYNSHLRIYKTYMPLSWKLIKAMIWTESGGPRHPNKAWYVRPMQIGNPTDPGLSSLLSGNEGGDLIMPPSIASTLTITSATSVPEKNIQAGIGYFLMRLANYTFTSVPDIGSATSIYTVKPGDSFSSIAAHGGSTIIEFQNLNPGVTILNIGSNIKFRKAKIQRKIVSFKPANVKAAADLYNTKDRLYAEKLSYCLKIMK